MARQRYLEILEHFRRVVADDPGNPAVCTVAVEVTQLAGAAVALCGDGSQFTTFCASSESMHTLINLEKTVGEGPCLDSFGTTNIVSAPLLGREGAIRWPVFAPLALAQGAEAIFATPVRIGASRLGALVLFHDQPGEMSEAQVDDLHVLSSIAARVVVAMQAGAPPDELGHELSRPATFDMVIQQAAGMVSVQGSMSVGDALVRIRAQGFATSRTSVEIAHLVVERRLRFNRTTESWVESPPADGKEHV